MASLSLGKMTILQPLKLLSHLKIVKSLSSSATISALRAFYLSVHPDFFAQHPQMQKVNESSLKRLNSYLEALQCTRQMKTLQPTKVAFYFRKDENAGGKIDEFKLVNFTLKSHDLLTNIEHILVSCGLSAAHLEEVAKKESMRISELPLENRYRKTEYDPLKWNNAFYNADERTREDAVPEISLRKWLRKNSHEIETCQESSKQIRENNESLKNDLCLNYGLREISWCSMWQHGSEKGILRNFARFCGQHKDRLRCLQGRKLVFTDRTMAAADESICLSVEYVPQQWLQFLSKYDEKFEDDYREARQHDNDICEKCGNIKIVRPKVRTSRFREHNLLSISEYLCMLDNFTSKLRSLPITEELHVAPWSLRNHEMIFTSPKDNDDEKVVVLSNSSVRVNGDCDPRYLLSFLIQNKATMDEKKYLDASEEAISSQLIQLCKEKFKLSNMTKDFDVSHKEMSICCERLLRNSAEFLVLFPGLELRITSNYYSIFDHGQFCIPWNWKT